MVMSFALTNAPATFQHFTNDVFQGLWMQYVVVHFR